MIKLLKLLQKRQHKKYDFQQRLEDISFPGLSPSLYHAHNVQLTAFLVDMVDFFAYSIV